MDEMDPVAYFMAIVSSFIIQCLVRICVVSIDIDRVNTITNDKR
jgi:hypothetical protein